MTVGRGMQNIDYRLWVYILPIPIILFYGLSLTGCVSNSPGMGNIFAVKLQLKERTNSTICELRVNYFGMCASTANQFICQATFGKTVSGVLQSMSMDNISNHDTSDASLLISFALTIQSKIILFLLAAAGVSFIVGLLLLLLLKRHLKATQSGKVNIEKRRQSLRLYTLVVIWTSVGLALASALTVSQVTAAMAYVTDTESVSAIQIKAGVALSVLQWLIFSFSILFAGGISMIFKKQGGVVASAGSMAQGTSAGGPPSFAPGPLPPPSLPLGPPPLPAAFP